MTAHDYTAYAKHFPDWKSEIGIIEKIAVLSGYDKQISLMRSLYPDISVDDLSMRSWDLNTLPPRSYDLVVAMNVFHYSTNPKLWFSNVLSSCKWFWMQDLINRYRDGLGQLGDDGDILRFKCPPLGMLSFFTNAFDISYLVDRIKKVVVYDGGGSTDPFRPSTHFLACIKGDLK